MGEVIKLQPKLVQAQKATKSLVQPSDDYSRRMQRIRESLERINTLMQELKRLKD